jgi:hypothetical protein
VERIIGSMQERRLYCVEVHGKNHFLENAQFFKFTIIRHKARQSKNLRLLSRKLINEFFGQGSFFGKEIRLREIKMVNQ